MPLNKSALIRYHIIDSCLTNTLKRYPSLDFIIKKIEDALETSLSDSMFNKDIAGMKSMYNAPIHYDRHHRGYCYTDDKFSIKKFPLTPGEIEALDFSTALLNQLKGTAMFEQFENAINKVIEGYRISKVLGKSEKQILQVEEPIKTEANKWLERILKAILHKSCLAIIYQGFNKEQKIHEFSPYLLKEYRNRWYAVGYSKKAKDILILALDRIRDIKKSAEKYHATPDFKPEDYFKYSLGITQVNAAKPETV
ncbi:MAG: WYL domain-containing protein, partial [Ginsengibacter sp.]